MAIVTVAQVRQHYPGLSGEDPLLGDLITRVDGLMAALCGFPFYDGTQIRTLEDQTYTLRLDRPRDDEPRCLELGLRPVVSVTSAYVDELWDFGAATQVAAGDLHLDTQRGKLWLTPDATSSWGTGPLVNKVVVVAGWTALPPDLVYAACAAVHHLLVNRHRQGVSNASANGQALTRQDATELLPKMTRLALGPYIFGGTYVG